MECPDETALSDFLAGVLSEERRVHVLAHVEACVDCQRVLAAGDDPPPSGEPDALEEEGRPPLARGSTLSRYVVLERIASGAMGVVYAAYDPELDRQVALKVLRPDQRHVEELQRRLLLEAQALARLSHANVVSIYDVGTCGDGVFLAMELIEGTTLADWLKEPHPWTEVLRVFREAGRGLAAAHAAGLVHRDFKPANILVGREGRVCVTDFGIARPLNREDDSAPQARPWTEAEAPSALTRTGALLGTPAYMAPELLQGRRADALSDQFSFCVALHEALHGFRPFEGNTLRELARAASEGRVRPPGPDVKVPAWVRRAVLRGLQPRPEERFPSMEGLLAALTPPRWRVRAAVAAAVAVASLLGAVGAYGLTHRREVLCEQEVEKLAVAWGPERRERVRAAFLATGVPYAELAWEKLAATLDAHAAQWRTLRAQACLAEGSGTPETAWQTAACLDTRLWQFAAVIEVLEKTDAETVENAQQLAGSLGGLTGCRDAPVLFTRPQPPDALGPRVAAARRTLAKAQAHLDAGRYSEGLGLTAGLLEEIRGLDYKPLEAEVLLTHGHLLEKVGKLKDAEELLYKAVWAAEAGRDDETAARAWSRLLWVVGDGLGKAADAERIAQHAQAAVERLGPERLPAITEDLHLALGVVLLQQGKFDRADVEISQGLELMRRTQESDTLRTALLLHQLARIRFRQLRFEEALALNRQVLELRERLLGPNHPELSASLNNLGSSYDTLGRRQEAIAAWRRALAILEQAHAPETRILSSTLHNLGMILRIDGRPEEARQYLERSRALAERENGPDHPSVATSLVELAMVELDLDHLDEALSLCSEALKRTERSQGAGSPRLAIPLRYRGLIHFKAGRYAEARRDMLESLKLEEQEHGPQSARLAFTLVLLARIGMAEGEPAEALKHCERAKELDTRAQGEQTPDVARDMTCLGEALLAQGAPRKAQPVLERAQQLYGSVPRDPLYSAWGSFLLARALAEQGPTSDRARAATLAEEARVRLEGLGPQAREDLKKVMAWQRRGTGL